MRSQPNPLAGLAFLHIAGLAVVRAPESTPYPTCAMGCSPALGDRPAEQVRAPSLAEVVDKSAYTGRLGYTHPTPALRLCPTPDRLLIRRGPRRPKTNFVDKGAFTGRMGYAHPTDAPGPAWTHTGGAPGCFPHPCHSPPTTPSRARTPPAVWLKNAVAP